RNARNRGNARRKVDVHLLKLKTPKGFISILLHNPHNDKYSTCRPHTSSTLIPSQYVNNLLAKVAPNEKQYCSNTHILIDTLNQHTLRRVILARPKTKNETFPRNGLMTCTYQLP
uniref:Uncharacterized protein n=1 Tax=Parascaris univalens TaxID=6257 RepID=A0A915AA00_PARUN